MLETKEIVEWTGGKTVHTPAQDLLWRSGPTEKVRSKTAGAHSCLQTKGVYEVGGEVPGKSLSGAILNGPQTLPR
jgi:hypothetical protein